MSETSIKAFEAIRNHHSVLYEQVIARQTALARAVAAGGPVEPARGALVGYLADEVLSHALAEEQTIYRVAAGSPALADTVAEMTAEHRTLAEGIARLAGSPDADEAVGCANEVATLLGAHIARENDVLLPALVSDEDVDLAQLLEQMHELTGAGQNVLIARVEAGDRDHEGAVLSLLLEGTTKLADAGYGDDACRLTAAAWAALCEPRPDLAQQVTSALHRLTRLAGAEQDGSCTCGGSHVSEEDPELDVRALAPAQRHETIFATYAGLAPGQGFVLVNDHDPKPLRYQFEAEHAGEFTWETLEGGPEVWRVRIGRPLRAGGPAGTPAAEPELDVRRLLHGRRHPTIFAAFNALDPGATFVLVNDHDPRPLRYQLDAQYADEYTWDYLEAGPYEWRVRIGRL